MFRRGIQSSLRMPGKTVLTAFLFFLTGALLGSMIGGTVSLEKTLDALGESYVTIAVADASRQEEVTDAEKQAQMLARLTAQEYPSYVKSWEAETAAQCYIPDSKSLLDAHGREPYGVVLVRIKGKGSAAAGSTVSGLVEEVLFSAQDVKGKRIKIEVGENGLEAEKRYLIFGKWYPGELGSNGTLALLHEPLLLEETDDPENLPAAAYYRDQAERLEVMGRSVSAVFPQDLISYYPFQQGILSLKSGRLFSPEESAGKEKACLISESLAKSLKVSVGETLTLALAVGPNEDGLCSYQPQAGWTVTGEYLVAGILNTQSAWMNTVFVTPDPSLQSGSLRSSRLGQFRLENGKAEEFILWTQENLPEEIQVRIYDQGYAEAAAPLKNMIRLARLLAVGACGAALCFLFLNVWLSVNRQRQAGRLMLWQGVSAFGERLYFLGALLLPAMAGLGAGQYFSSRAAEVLSGKLLEAAWQSGTETVRYSNTRLNFQSLLELGQQRAPEVLYRWIMGGIALLSVFLCLIFTAGLLKARKQKSCSLLRRTRTRTHYLRQGPSGYIRLSAIRGGFRTAVSLAAPMIAILLFSLMSSVFQQSRDELSQLDEASSVRGYFTSLSGKMSTGLVLQYRDVEAIAALPQTLHLTIGGEEKPYFYVGRCVKTENGKGLPIEEGFSVPEITHSSFQADRLSAWYAKTLPIMIETSSLLDVPGKMFREDPAVTWAECWSDERFAEQTQMQDWLTQGTIAYICNPDVEIEKYWRDKGLNAEEIARKEAEMYIQVSASLLISEQIRTPCGVSEAFLREHGLSLGDSFFVASDFGASIIQMTWLEVVGCYSSQNDDFSIYYPVTLKDKQPLDRVSGAVFRFRCTDLDALREELTALGISEVGQTSSARKPFVIEDQRYLATRHVLEQRLWYMEHLFPAAVILTELAALGISLLQVLARKKELALMHLNGCPGRQSFGSVFGEQLLLCLGGALLGLAFSWQLGFKETEALMAGGGFVLLWLLGSAVSCGTLMRNIRTGRRGKAWQS